MHQDRWRTARRWSTVAILSLETLALAGLGLSLLLVGSLTGPFIDDFVGEGGHRVTLTLVGLGIASWMGSVAFVVIAVAIVTMRGYVGTSHAWRWHAIFGVGLLLETGWLFLMASSDVDPGMASRISWCVGLALSAWTIVCLWLELRERMHPEPRTLPPPPVVPARLGSIE